MFENESRVLLIFPQDVLDGVRVLAGKATSLFKLPVSLQIVLRALIEEGLKRDGDRIILANVEAQAQAVRRIRSMARKGRNGEAERRVPPSAIPRKLSGRARQERGK